MMKVQAYIGSYENCFLKCSKDCLKTYWEL